MTAQELAACRAAGCRPVSLGPRVLRAETAAIAAAALLQFLRGDLAAEGSALSGAASSDQPRSPAPGGGDD